MVSMSRKLILEYAFPLSIELAGIFMLVVGIAVELSTGADFGHVIISIGSCVIALGSVIWAKILGGKR